MHLDSVNFALIVPRMTTHQIGKRAELIHKDLTSRRFDFGDGGALSIQINMGVATLPNSSGQSPKALVSDLYQRAEKALDEAKVQGNHIQISD